MTTYDCHYCYHYDYLMMFDDDDGDDDDHHHHHHRHHDDIYPMLELPGFLQVSSSITITDPMPCRTLTLQADGGHRFEAYLDV